MTAMEAAMSTATATVTSTVTSTARLKSMAKLQLTATAGPRSYAVRDDDYVDDDTVRK